MQMVICACSNKRWIKKLSNLDWPWPTRITGWTDEMHAFIHGSDIVMTKAGGATVMECISSKKPIIIIEAIPGQETGNVMLIQKYNLGVVMDRDFSNFDHAVEYILSHANLIKKNMAALGKPNAAMETAKFLTGLVKDRSN